MSREDDKFQRYDPENDGSIDGTDTTADDYVFLRPLESQYTPNRALCGDMRNAVVVGRLHPWTTQATLAAEFSDCGKIISCRLLKDVTNEFELYYYGFIEFEQSSSVDKAVNKYRDYIDNTEVVVNGEKERGAENHGG